MGHSANDIGLHASPSRNPLGNDLSDELAFAVLSEAPIEVIRDIEDQIQARLRRRRRSPESAGDFPG